MSSASSTFVHGDLRDEISIPSGTLAEIIIENPKTADRFHTRDIVSKDDPTLPVLIVAFVIAPYCNAGKDFKDPGPQQELALISLEPGNQRSPTSIEGPPPDCTPAAIEGFPKPIIDAEMRARGFVVLHIFIAACNILLISVLCKDYFVPALDVLIARLGMDPDVAGGTFMAAAGSISPLVTSILGVNVAENDLGLSTSLSSGVLKAAGVLSIAALFAKETVKLSAWPLLRSSFSFLAAILVILWCLLDNRIEAHESLLCLATYALYVVVMTFSKHLEKLFSAMTSTQETRNGGAPEAANDKAQVVLELEAPVGVVLEETADPKAWENLSLSKKAVFILLTPFSCAVSFVIPDCKKPGSEKFFIVTLLLSGGLIAAASYVLVWMLAIIGFTFGIPDSVLGLTLLSISNTLPDIISSIIVVRKGFGDMAVSYLLGTNVFELLIGLGLPWLLQTTVIKPGAAIELKSSGLIHAGLIVLATACFMPLLARVCRWKMTKTFGVVLLSWYATFVLASTLYQLNVFGFVNQPSCFSAF